MRALTVRQPWAWAIVHGGKNVENRTRNIAGAYRGPLAIHAGLAKYEQDNDASRAHRAAHGTEVDTVIVFGAIIGVVDLVGVHLSKRSQTAARRGLPVCFDDASPIGDLCSEWAQPDHHHLVLANPRPLAEPIPWRGQLGLWRVPDDLEHAIREQVQP